MFERFTEAGRISLLLARYEAARAGASQVTPDHLLLALLSFQWRLFAPFFQNRSNAGPLRADVESQQAQSPDACWDVPMSLEAKRVLAYAMEEADGLRHKNIGPEHLLLGILHEEQSASARVLRRYGVDAAAIRERAAAEWRDEPHSGRGWTAAWRVGDMDR